LVIINHKQQIPIGIIPDNLFPITIGNIKKALPHGKLSPPDTLIPLKVIEGYLIFHASDFQGEQVFPGNGRERFLSTGPCEEAAEDTYQYPGVHG
jgi:hypothetical protein